MRYNKLVNTYPVLPCPQFDVPPYTVTTRYSNYPGAKPYDVTIRNILYTAMSDGDLLIVTAYHDGAMIWRTYFDGDEHVVQKSDGSKSTKCIDNLVTYDAALFAVNNADFVIMRHFKLHHWYHPTKQYWGALEQSRGLKCIAERQDYLRKRKLDAKHDKIRKSIDNDMLCIRPEPKGFWEWLRKDVCKHYILYKTGSKEGVCTCCGCKTPFKGKHNDVVRCKHCHTRAALKCEGRYKDNSCFDNFDKAYLVQKTSSGFVERLYDVRLAVLGKKSQHICAADSVVRRPLTDKFDLVAAVSEVGRYFLRDDLTTLRSCYEMATPSNLPYDWYRRSDMYGYCGQIYPGNIDGICKDIPAIKYMPLGKIVRAGSYAPHYLFECLQKYPWLEYTAKLGLMDITASFISCSGWERQKYMEQLNLDGKNILQILGITKADIEPLKKMHAQIDDMELYKAAKLRRTKPAELNRLLDLCGKSKAVTLLKYSTAAAALRYIPEQRKLYAAAGRADNVLYDYCDYLKDAAAAGYNLDDSAIIRPHNLIEAHELADAEATAQDYYKRGLQYAAAIIVRAAERDGLDYAEDVYIIKQISSLEELCNETRVLNHCVGSYACQVASGTAVICSVRRADNPDVPLTTIELKPDYSQIVQRRAYKNSTPPDDIIAVIDRWHKKIQSKSRKAG